jgi:hypothetical protein
MCGDAPVLDRFEELGFVEELQIIDLPDLFSGRPLDEVEVKFEGRIR